MSAVRGAKDMPSITEPANPSAVSTENPPPTPGLRRRRRGRLIVLAIFLLVLLAVVPPFININRFRRSILQSVSAGLGRPVYARSVDLSLFPRPAFVLHDLTVAEDPAYGAEPVLMAGVVTADLRASTLWHRRVEIASLHFDAPSLNLARDAAGRWNFESLLRNSPALHSEHEPVPTDPSPFPYIDATDARINFKHGLEKLPFSLEGADLAVWKESGNEWHVRIRAHPVRTDLTAADAGEIRGEGSLAARNTLAESPLKVHLEWRRVELGEMARLLQGTDNGWRGIVDWNTDAHGTLADLVLASQLGIQAFHRAEFMPLDEMDLSAHCTGRYEEGNRQLDSLRCVSPLDGGNLLLDAGFSDGSRISESAKLSNPAPTSAGNFGVPESGRAFVRIDLQHAPAGFFLNLLRHIHPGVPEEATALGMLNGTANCPWRGTTTLDGCTGRIRSSGIALRLASTDPPIRFSPILISTAAIGRSPDVPIQPFLSSGVEIPSTGHAATAAGAWDLSPAHVSLGGANAAVVTGSLGPRGSTLRIAGPADLKELANLATALRIPALPGQLRSVRGSAQLALTFTSFWLPRSAASGAFDTPANEFTPFAPSLWTGGVQIRDASLTLASLPGTLHLISAQVNMTPGIVEWTHLKGVFSGIPFDGSLSWQAPCPTVKSDCSRTFAIHTAHLNLARIQSALRASSGSRDLFSAINPWAKNPSGIPEISGTLKADVVNAGRGALKDAALRVLIRGHRADLLAISGRAFGGTLSGSAPAIPTALPAGTETAIRGTGSAQWGDGPPVYRARLSLDNIRPDKVAALWDEKWGAGVANVQLDIHTNGWSAAEIASNVRGRFDLTWKDGTLTVPLVPDRDNVSEVTKFDRWYAAGSIRQKKLLFDHSQIVFEKDRGRKPAALRTQSVSGSVSFDRTVHLKFQPSGLSLSGALDHPTATYAPGPQPMPDAASVSKQHPAVSKSSPNPD